MDEVSESIFSFVLKSVKRVHGKNFHNGELVQPLFREKINNNKWM